MATIFVEQSLDSGVARIVGNLIRRGIVARTETLRSWEAEALPAYQLVACLRSRKR